MGAHPWPEYGKILWIGLYPERYWQGALANVRFSGFNSDPFLI